MAIFKEFEVRIKVNGEYAREFDDNDDELADKDPTDVVKYVEVMSGAPFEVETTITNLPMVGGNVVAASHYLDGNWSGSPHVRSRKQTLASTNLSGSRTVSGQILNNDGKFLKWNFADIETREMSANDDTTTIKDKYSQLGTIRVEYKRAIKPKSPMRRSSRRFSPPSSLMDRIPEKALKGRPIQVRTNNSEEIRGPQPFYSSKKVDDEPLARFIFKYRTKEALQTERVIPRTPSPDPIDNMSAEELRAMIRQQRDAQNMKQEKGVKRERSESPGDSTTNKKRIFSIDSADVEVDEQNTSMNGEEHEVEVVDLSEDF